MPRVASLDGVTEKDRGIYALIVSHMITNCETDIKFAKRLHLNIKTFQYKKRQPHKFTVEELHIVVKVLKFTNEEKVMCL